MRSIEITCLLCIELFPIFKELFFFNVPIYLFRKEWHYSDPCSGARGTLVSVIPTSSVTENQKFSSLLIFKGALCCMTYGIFEIQDCRNYSILKRKLISYNNVAENTCTKFH